MTATEPIIEDYHEDIPVASPEPNCIQFQPDPKTYLGDGAYVRWDGHGFVLTSENGVAVLNEIYLEPAVLAALNRFADGVTKKPEQQAEQEFSPAVTELLTKHRAKVDQNRDSEAWILRNNQRLIELAKQGIHPVPYGDGMDFDNLSHSEVMAVVKAFPGKWNKNINGAYSDRIDYTSTFDGSQVRCWSGEPPPSCRIIEEEVPVPATTRIVRRLQCGPEETPAS